VCLGHLPKTEFLSTPARDPPSNRRARRDDCGITQRRLDAASFAVLVRTRGAEIGLRTINNSEAGELDQPVPARFRVRDSVCRRCRRYQSEPAEPPLRHRVDQRLSSVVMAQPGRRYCRDACALPWRRSGSGGALCLTRGFPAAQIRQCAGQLHSGAPNVIASAGIGSVRKPAGSALRYRYFGPRPLTETMPLFTGDRIN